MALLTLNDLQLAYGHVALLDHTSFALEARERVSLIGRNGAGKSSLLKILAGVERPDDGTMQFQQGLRRVYVAQEPVLDPGATVFDAVSDGVSQARALRARYEAHAVGDDLDALQARIEALDGWTWEQRVDETLERLALPRDAVIGSLSGGTTKRVALAQALVARPDLLLLDEPTNHLDLEGILWLQGLLIDFSGAVVFVTHDRAFLDAVATRIVELDRGVLRSYPGRYTAYEAVKADQMNAQALAFARQDKLLAQEEVWVRKGVEARRTRSVGRVARLEALRSQRAARREQVGSVRLALDAGARSGKLVAELEGVGKSFGDKVVLHDVNTTILRGDRVGILGPNGSGKTTLLKTILGDLEPDRGRVRRGTNLQVAYFDQMREALDLNATLADTISHGSEFVEIGTSAAPGRSEAADAPPRGAASASERGGPRRKHVMSYLGDFLFAPERARAPVSTLSGGERNRLLLARLFARPANVLVLDEPTNDLDIDTLELLEELLQTYAGTVFLVSHDRRFVDNVVTSTIVSQGQGRWREYEGGVDDWLLQAARAATITPVPSGRDAADIAPKAARSTPEAPAKPRRKLAFKEQRELEQLPARIEALEVEQAQLAATMADTQLYREAPERVAAVHARHAAIEDELMQCLERWQALEGG